MTMFEARYVLGEPTISGSTWFDESVQRRGLGTEVYDMLEQAAGLPRVPHGRNGNIGILTEMSEPFWRKRADARRVPGYGDPAVDARLAMAKEGSRLRGLEGQEFSSTDDALILAVHRATGWPIELVQSPEPGSHPDASLCRMPDGRVFNIAGVGTEADLLARFDARKRGIERVVVSGNPDAAHRLELSALSRYSDKTRIMAEALDNARYVYTRHTGHELPELGVAHTPNQGAVPGI